MAETLTAGIPPATDTRFFGHPRGLATCFFTEMWERYSYYGTRALLLLYMTDLVIHGGMGFTVVKGGLIYGFYVSMVYLLTLPGGWIADRIIGQRKAVLLGGILISAGNFCLASPGIAAFYSGLVLLMMGSTFYQQKQMMQNATGPQAKQMQMMSRVMPLILGFVSLNIPAGVIVYWVISNVWTIGQQSYFLKRQPATPGAGDTGKPGQGKGKPPNQPALKPKQPTHSSAAPTIVSVSECGVNASLP